MAENNALTQKFGKLLRASFDNEGLNAMASLSPVERVLAYYLYRGAVAGYRIGLFQLCPYPRTLDVLYQVIKKYPEDGDKAFYEQLTSWWVYLFANLGVHCQRETENNKKVPEQMDLGLVTKEKVAERVKEIGEEFSEDEWKYLFDKDYFPTATVQQDIENSGCSFFPKGYTQEMYNKLSKEEKECLIAYHTAEGMQTYSTKGVCSAEMTEVVKWMKLAQAHSEKHSDVISADIPKSIDLLVQSFETGEEKYFKEHSKVWLKLQNKVEFTMGFIEYYDDPMSHVGTFQADVTVKSQDITPLLLKLPTFEKRFPFPEEYKRKDMSSIPNAAPANKIVGMGGLGPVFSTLAYCLPNYSDVRSEIGSKQVMYPAPSPSDVPRYLSIYFSEEDREVFKQYSPDIALERAVSSLVTTLHETVGHASGNMIEGVTEKVRNERVGKWGNGLEEMRAEILALYVTFKFYDEVVETGFLGKWPEIVPKEHILRFALDDVAGGGWRRWRGLPSGTTAISQAHALADTGIMYYLIDNAPEGLISLVEESVDLPEGVTLPVLRLKATNVEALLPTIEKCAQIVQTMSSTADQKMVEEFMNKYAAHTRDPRYADIVTGMRNAAAHGVIETVNVFPELTPKKEGEDIVDVDSAAPSSALQHFLDIFELSRPGTA
mmetsp:Transcript_9209/g.13943  ORF Transcript_9209/g.13943 Transcript_9209/m.13943 type:complete len:660 (-) Transcript_9209:59-2038(-)